MGGAGEREEKGLVGGKKGGGDGWIWNLPDFMDGCM